MISLLLFACATKIVDIGTVDISEQDVCVLQLSDETIVEIKSELCSNLREGDVIKVVRKNERR